MMRSSFLQNPTVELPSWSPFHDHLPSINFHLPITKISGDYSLTDSALTTDLTDPPIDKYSSDEFRMYDFKVRRCTRSRSHDWTECPFAHPGEKARRRDPRNHHYSAVSCPDFRKGACNKADACEFAHGVFECWLHPARYRTQVCKDGVDCRRRVCFFAHTPEQVRVLPVMLQRRSFAPLDACFAKGAVSSPTSTLISPASSPPVSPVMKEIVASIGSLRLGGEFRAVFCGAPPVAAEEAAAGEEDEVVVRVESGRALRVKMYERLSRKRLGGAEFDPAGQSGPDFGWVSELIK